MSEKLTPTGETNLETIGEAAAERAQELSRKTESASGEHLSPNAERAQVEALFNKEISSSERKHHSADSSPTIRSKPLPKMATKKDRSASYKQTMHHISAEMSAPERVFSTVIHNPVVEKVSDTVGSTLARPNAILAGSFTAFILTMVVYVVARNMGYALSGFETIGAFVVGWALGLIYDYAKTMFSGKAS